MATKKKTTKQEGAADPGVVEKSAKAVGAVPGNIAAKTGGAKAAPKKSGRFAKSDKKRLPRKEKKRLMKARKGI